LWWVAGGGALVALANRSQAQAARVGDLVVRVTMKPGTVSMPAVNAILNGLLGVRGTVCPTFPQVVSATGAPAVVNDGLQATFSATWTHDRLGVIKADARACALKYLQGLNPNVLDFAAERVS
jgi:hypothetical protein